MSAARRADSPSDAEALPARFDAPGGRQSGGGMVTATKSRQLAGRRERGCESFADSPGDKWCQPPKLGEGEKVTATKSRQLAGNRERGCPSFADSPASTACVYKCAAQLMQRKR
jgi:hypothetical protein